MSQDEDIQQPNGNEDCCSICLEVLGDPIVELPCHHKFCASCLNQWRSKFDIQSTKTCPECRRQIPPTKDMIRQMKLYEQKLAQLRERLSSLAPFVFPEEIQPGGFARMVDQVEIQGIQEAPADQHDKLFRICYQGLERNFAEFIQTTKEKMGDYDTSDDGLLKSHEEDILRIPGEVYDAAGFEYDDISKVLDWLGPAPIPKDRINAKNPDHMDNTLLHVTAKTFEEDVGIMGFLLQNGADVNAQNCVGATAFETVAFRFEFDAQARLLLEWGARKESNLIDLPQATREGGNSALAHLIQTPLGGRRCEIMGLSKRSDLNGTTGIAGKYIAEKDRYVVMVEGKTNKESVLVKTSNLKRRDRTADDCGVEYHFEADTQRFSKVCVV